MADTPEDHIKYFSQETQRKLGSKYKTAKVDLDSLVSDAGANPDATAAKIAAQYYKNVGHPLPPGIKPEELHGELIKNMGDQNYQTMMNHLKEGDVAEAVAALKKGHQDYHRASVTKAKIALIQNMPMDDRVKMAQIIIKDNKGLKGANPAAVAENLPDYFRLMAGYDDQMKSMAKPLTGASYQKRIHDIYGDTVKSSAK